MALPWQGYGTSPTMWEHTVLSATQHKWTHPTLTPGHRRVFDLRTPEGWKAELTHATQQSDGRESNPQPLDHESNALTTTPLNHPRYMPDMPVFYSLHFVFLCATSHGELKIVIMITDLPMLRLECHFGLHGIVLSWFRSYVIGRMFSFVWWFNVTHGICCMLGPSRFCLGSAVVYYRATQSARYLL